MLAVYTAVTGNMACQMRDSADTAAAAASASKDAAGEMKRTNDIAIDSRRARLGARLKISGSVPPGAFSKRKFGPEGRTIVGDVPEMVDIAIVNSGKQAARDVIIASACVRFLADEPADVACSLWTPPPPKVIEPLETVTEPIYRGGSMEHFEEVWDGKLSPFIVAVIRYDDGNGRYWRNETCLRVGSIDVKETINPTRECRLHNTERPE